MHNGEGGSQPQVIRESSGQKSEAWRSLFRWLANAVLVLVLAMLVRSSYGLLKNPLQGLAQPPWDDATYERRVDEMKPLLPADGMVCYLDRNSASFQETARYFQTEYALSPRLVVRETGCQFLIADFPDGDMAEIRSGATSSFALVHDYGQGLTLWERRVEAVK